MRIYLRPVTLEDGESIVRWRNSPSVSEHCFDKRMITLESNAAFYRAFIETGKYKQFIVEKIEEDFGVASYPIATVYLKDFDTINNRCELCVYTSDDQEWNTESQSIAIKLLVERAFTEYKMHKIYTYVFATNVDEVELLKNSGFQEEALLKQEAINAKGEYVDILRMKIIRSR
ncbi:MAG: GNAT family N-acetyltransferase [Synergistaceae bacterium]|nr:GNAT family N-acetyltransferase [Synergistaceae bacterium]